MNYEKDRTGSPLGLSRWKQRLPTNAGSEQPALSLPFLHTPPSAACGEAEVLWDVWI